MQTLGELRVVSFADAALDWDAMAAAEAAERGTAKRIDVVSRYARCRDPKMVRELPGQRLTWFVLRRIDVDVLDWVMAAESEYLRHSRAFQHAVVRIEDLVSMDGREIAQVRPEASRQVGPVTIEHLSDAQMRMIAPQYREEIGGVALDRSFLAPKSAAFYRLPRSFQLTLMSKMQSVAAEAVKAAATLDSSKAQEEGPTPDATGSGTGATATAKATSPKKRRSRAKGARGKSRSGSSS